jgi:hypothetical protein
MGTSSRLDHHAARMRGGAKRHVLRSSGLCGRSSRDCRPPPRGHPSIGSRCQPSTASSAGSSPRSSPMLRAPETPREHGLGQA